jgi:outer membrane protein assembly factor BamB
VAWRNYLMFTDNAGVLQCVNLNTMELVYVNDLGNDSDVTMVLEEIPEEQRVYLYAGCEYDDDVMNVQPGTGPCYAYKIDAMTGEIIWKVPFTADSGNDRVDGGILASPVLGREGTTLEGLVIYNVTQMVSGDSNTSVLVAIDKETGEIVWTYDMGVEGWSSSSPVAVYSDRKDASGKTIAYLVQCEIGGVIALIRVDGAYENGYTEVDKLSVNDEIGETGNNFEATPAVFGNTIVIASRSDHVFFITIN